MASNKGSKRGVKKVNFAYLHRLSSAVALIGLVVVMLAGIMNDLRWITIAFRGFAVCFVVIFMNKVVVKILASYEEINSGKA